ncbi:hypothetical protein Tco_0824291 [Tanacetum coccineum]|uniref:Uncharacterized protein n=1 Tax=Tanacetum coccineum TaxID=301880 RepID=A0ABQ5AN04_9ASTR
MVSGVSLGKLSARKDIDDNRFSGSVLNKLDGDKKSVRPIKVNIRCVEDENDCVCPTPSKYPGEDMVLEGCFIFEIGTVGLSDPVVRPEVADMIDVHGEISGLPPHNSMLNC